MSEPTPENTLPRYVDARKLVNVEAQFNRRLAISDLERLAECSHSIDFVEVDLCFSRDEQSRPTLVGSIDANMELLCQRCLEPMSFAVQKEVRLLLVWDEAQAKALPKDAEPWIVGEGEVDLVEIIEEEVLLTLPVVARHEFDCLDLSSLNRDDEAPKESAKSNPFQVLEQLNLKK